jgi:hypothetical protein
MFRTGAADWAACKPASRCRTLTIASMLSIRRFQDQDWPHVWSILRETNAGGDTFALAQDAPESQMRAIWVEAPLAAYVACSGAPFVTRSSAMSTRTSCSRN